MARYGLSPLGRGLFSLVLPFVILGSMSGQQLVLGIGIAVAMLMGLGYLWSALVVRKVEVSASVSGDVTLGETVEVLVSVTGPDGLECALEIMKGETLGVKIPARGSVLAVANEMGRFEEVPVVIQTGVPDGVVGAVKRRKARLAEARYVYPGVVPVTVPIAPNTTGPVPTDSGDFSGLREYTPGDKLRDVHWPALARTGTVLVRDHRSSAINGRVTVALAATPDDKIETLAGMARSAIHQLIQRGHQVHLLMGSELGAVSSEIEAWRRLACLSPGQKPDFGAVTGLILTVDVKRGTTWVTQV